MPNNLALRAGLLFNTTNNPAASTHSHGWMAMTVLAYHAFNVSTYRADPFSSHFSYDEFYNFMDAQYAAPNSEPVYTFDTRQVIYLGPIVRLGVYGSSTNCITDTLLPLCSQPSGGRSLRATLDPRFCAYRTRRARQRGRRVYLFSDHILINVQPPRSQS